MVKVARWWGVVLLVLALIGLGGCVSRQRVLLEEERLLSAQTAGRSELLEYLEERSRAVRTLSAKVALAASAGSGKSGVVTDYRRTTGFLLVERPNRIRLKGQAPLALATVFDMVSDGYQYRVSVPVQNKFIVGDVRVPTAEKNPILNLRPQHLSDALFVDVLPYLTDSNIRSVLEEARSGRRQFYVFVFIDIREPVAQIVEKIWIDRASLQVSRKQVFGKDGVLQTDVHFGAYRDLDGVAFPTTVVIERLPEDYTLAITFEQTELNVALRANTFLLEQPPGSELVEVSSSNPASF